MTDTDTRQADRAALAARAARNDYREERNWLAATPRTRRYLKSTAARADRRAARLACRTR